MPLVLSAACMFKATNVMIVPTIIANTAMGTPGPPPLEVVILYIYIGLKEYMVVFYTKKLMSTTTAITNAPAPDCTVLPV